MGHCGFVEAVGRVGPEGYGTEDIPSTNCGTFFFPLYSMDYRLSDSISPAVLLGIYDSGNNSALSTHFYWSCKRRLRLGLLIYIYLMFFAG